MVSEFYNPAISGLVWIGIDWCGNANADLRNKKISFVNINVPIVKFLTKT